MKRKVLTSEQIDQFIEQGCVRVPEVFSREAAAAAREFLWQRIGLDANDSSQWTQPMIHLQECHGSGPFADALTPRFDDICDDVMGEGRWHSGRALGWWPISFPGFDSGPWQEPQAGWHVDGQSFHHHVNSPDQGLLPIFLFSDIQPGDGGTALSLGSHKVTARILAEAEPEGLEPNELARRVAAHPRNKIIEGTGCAGDVLLMHPFMLHARSMNTGNRVRFLCNPCIAFREPMNLHRMDATEYSPVERAIVQALETVEASD